MVVDGGVDIDFMDSIIGWKIGGLETALYLIKSFSTFKNIEI